jgi:plasmid stability protein
MKPISIRNIPESTLAGLKRRAARHKRSLQQEVHVLLDEAASMAPVEESTEGGLKLYMVNTGQDLKWDREDLYTDDDAGLKNR